MTFQSYPLVDIPIQALPPQRELTAEEIEHIRQKRLEAMSKLAARKARAPPAAASTSISTDQDTDHSTKEIKNHTDLDLDMSVIDQGSGEGMDRNGTTNEFEEFYDSLEGDTQFAVMEGRNKDDDTRGDDRHHNGVVNNDVMASVAQLQTNISLSTSKSITTATQPSSQNTQSRNIKLIKPTGRNKSQQGDGNDYDEDAAELAAMMFGD